MRVRALASLIIMGKGSLVRLVPAAVSQKMTYSVRLALSKKESKRKHSLDETTTNTNSSSSSPSSSSSSSPSSSPCLDDSSVKFGRKVQYVNYLHELQQHMGLEQLPIPKQVVE